MATVRLTHRIPRTIEVACEGELTALDAGAEPPSLPFADASVEFIEAIDVLEHVMDEEAWLRECARILRPGGVIHVQVPHDGATSWLESMNIYRYAVDVVGIGKDPRETKLIGWHRQYREQDLRAMLAKAGLRPVSVRKHSLGLAELPALVDLAINDGLRKVPDAGPRVKARRQPIERLDARIPAGPFSRRIRVTATRG